MDNSFFSQIKRGLKVTTSYLLTLILFLVFSVPIMSMAKNNIEGSIYVFSILLFLILFYSVYVEMRILAFKEKRPQYNINPSPFKGLFYGIIGIIPYAIIEIVLISLRLDGSKIPPTLVRRAYQAVGAPLYWFARLIGNLPYHYILSFILVILIAGLGYYAGYKEFYLVETIRCKLGIKKGSAKKGN